MSEGSTSPDIVAEELTQQRERERADKLIAVGNDVLQERHRQDAQHGGPDHDDTHTSSEWAKFRQIQEERVAFATLTRGSGGRAIVREALVKIAALAMAQIEALDRTKGQP